MDSCPEKNESYLWQRGKRKGAKCVCSKIVKRPNLCFLRKFLGCKAPINVHMMWNMNRPGLWLTPQCKAREELELARQAAISGGKREAFHLNCASSHSRGTEEVIQVRKCQDVEMWEKGAWGLPWPCARWQPWVLAIISIMNPTTTAGLHT